MLEKSRRCRRREAGRDVEDRGRESNRVGAAIGDGRTHDRTADRLFQMRGEREAVSAGAGLIRGQSKRARMSGSVEEAQFDSRDQCVSHAGEVCKQTRIAARYSIDGFGSGKVGKFTSSGERIIDTVPEIEAAEVDEAGGDVPAQDNWGGRLTAFRALRHRNFRLFFVGQLISLIGTWMQMVAQAWLVLKLTNSSMMLGIVSFAGFMPIVLVALFAGVVVDHVDRRRLIIGAQTLLMLSAFVLAATDVGRPSSRSNT